ncbi:MAG: phage portal protein [Marinosulfonomonas sp.]|nr:MAG: phage portal protein [Marinosulfonomonas sp.]
MTLPFGISIFRAINRDAAKPQTRQFDAAADGRRGSSFGRFFGSHGPETLAAAGPVRSRARHAYANNPWIRNGVNAIVAETVGAGIEANSAHPDATTRAEIDELFSTAATSIDLEGRTDLRGLTAEIVRAEIVDGEAFAVIEETETGVRLRLIPAEFVDESDTRELSNGGYIVAGIEFNAEGVRRAYHIRQHRPTEIFTTSHATIRVPAESVLHIFRPLGPGQVRGISQLSPILLTANEFDQLHDALLVGTKVAAMHAGFIVDQNTIGSAIPEANGLEDVSLEPGVIRVLPAGTDIRFSSPDQAKDGIAFARLTLGQIAAGLGVPQHLLDGDLSNANYSSLRAGLLPFRAKVEQFVYHTLIPQFLDPVFCRVITREYLSGSLDVADLAHALKAEWLPPRPMQVDPAKDAGAMRDLIDQGLMSRRQAVASLGWNIAELDTEIAADRAREADLGLSFNGETNDQA